MTDAQDARLMRIRALFEPRKPAAVLQTWDALFVLSLLEAAEAENARLLLELEVLKAALRPMSDRDAEILAKGLAPPVETDHE